MKALLIILISLVPMSLYSEEARIIVKCDPKIKIVVNGQGQNDSGPKRGYSMEVNGSANVKIFSYFDEKSSGNSVINSTTVSLKAGQTVEVDFRSEAQKKAEIEIVKPKPKLDFKLFGKTDLKKPDLGVIIGKPKKPDEPKKEELKFNPVKRVVSSNLTADSNCSTGQCTTSY